MKDRLLAALVLGGVGSLLLELRFEHRDALANQPASWIPIAYCAVLIVAGAVALLRWGSWGRVTLGALFAAGIAVGLCGVWFHNGGHPAEALSTIVNAWRGTKIGDRPPPLAPLAFCGLGAIGTVTCFGKR
jgi:hypothetical protein